MTDEERKRLGVVWMIAVGLDFVVISATGIFPQYWRESQIAHEILRIHYVASGLIWVVFGWK